MNMNTSNFMMKLSFWNRKQQRKLGKSGSTIDDQQKLEGQLDTIRKWQAQISMPTEQNKKPWGMLEISAQSEQNWLWVKILSGMNVFENLKSRMWGFDFMNFNN